MNIEVSQFHYCPIIILLHYCCFRSSITARKETKRLQEIYPLTFRRLKTQSVSGSINTYEVQFSLFTR